MVYFTALELKNFFIRQLFLTNFFVCSKNAISLFALLLKPIFRSVALKKIYTNNSLTPANF